MHIYADYEAKLASIVAALVRDKKLPEAVAGIRLGLDQTKDASHGDFASNAAMVLAKPAGMKPRDIAELLKPLLEKTVGVAKVDIAGPGFVNITVDRAVWPGIVGAIQKEGEKYGRSDAGGGKKVNVEYVSANPTGPLHVGHCRGAVVGDTLANLLAFAGFDVTREYYINDAGGQVDVLARSAYLRYCEANGQTIEIPEGLYPGDYLKPVGEALAKTHGKSLLGKPEAEWLAPVRTFALEAMMDLIRDDLAQLNIKHDVFSSERALTIGNQDMVAETIAELRKAGHVFQGKLDPPKGEVNPDWEDREQTLFRSTAFGDDADRALLKSNGSYTYFAPDIAYHKTKWDRGFTHMIDVLGADHAGYKKRLQAAVAAVSGGKGDLDVVFCNLVKLFKGGQPFKMSKRAGTFITVRDVVDEVGRDPVRFMMLFRKNDSPLDFDFDKVTEQSKDNPVFYVQYACARASSIFRKATEVFPDFTPGSPAIFQADLKKLVDDGEISLIKRLAQFPRLIEQSAGSHEPHRLAFYLYELASEFHGLWNRGIDLPHLRFIREDDKATTAARLALTAATRQILATGLGILGVHAPEEMR
jgi:arginyl-tRNA synthetase